MALDKWPHLRERSSPPGRGRWRLGLGRRQLLERDLAAGVIPVELGLLGLLIRGLISESGVGLLAEDDGARGRGADSERPKDGRDSAVDSF